MTYSDFILSSRGHHEYDDRGSVFSFASIKECAFVVYGLAGGYGRGEGAFSEAPFFRADRDSGKPTVINQLLGRIRHEKAKLAAEKGESVREQSHARVCTST